MKAIQHILVEPILTEKSAGYLLDEKADVFKYTFKVGMAANKYEIKQAIQTRFNVEVDSVNTTVVRGKMKRIRGRIGKAANWKKAIIKLKAGNKISEFEGA
jgi:large subunit ribosomal protein L23